MQAVKGIASQLVNNLVSPYVENLDPKDLNFSVLSGHIQLNNLHLKKSVLERFGLPVEIVAGDIGHLDITIPWSALKNSPAQIEISDIYILARARPQGKVDPEEDERVEQATKQERLKNAEAVDNAASQVGVKAPTGEGQETYIQAVTNKIVSNVQVRVKNIHIRYEDGTSAPEHPFAAGMTLSELSAISTDGNWVETFIQDSLHGVHKLAKLSGLSIYFDTDTGSLDKGAQDRQGTLDALESMLVGSPKHQYILKPVTGEARVILNKTMSSEAPKIDAQVIFDEIGVVFDRDQYRDALSMVDVFHFYRRTHQYHKFRPSEEEFKQNQARARLRFALNAISSEIHERRRRWTWEYMAQRRDTRKRYVEVYVKKLALPENKPLAPEDDGALKEMEVGLSYEDIRFFRSVARAQAKKDAATRRKLEAESRANQPQRQTWGQWMWGVPKAEDEGGMSDEAKKEIDDIIDYDATAAVSIDSAARDFMKARVSATLNKGSFSLRTDPHGANNDIIALVFDSFSADAVQLTDSVSGKIALGGFRVYDGTTSDTLYPQIVRVKDIDGSSNARNSSRQSSLDVAGTESAIAEISDGMEKDNNGDVDPFFVMEVEQNPLDGHADNVVKVRMRHLEIIYHKGYVEAVVAFFKPPASQLESINALLDAAGQTLDGIRKETRAGLEYALEQHKTVDIRVDMNAPIIIIPMDIRKKDSQALVLDAGHIAVESKLADQDKLKEVQSKRGRQYSNEDFRQLEDLMYDKMSLRLESTQLLMGPSIEACMKAIENPHAAGESDLHILERINMSFTVQNAIVNAPNLTRFKIAGDLPELQVNFSDKKYKTLMRFIDVAIPKFGDDEPPPDAHKAIQATTRPSFRQPKIEEYTLDDTRSVVSHRTAEHDDRDDDDSSIDGKGTDQFYEARDDQTDSQRAAIQQVTFEFKFAVGRLKASLFKSTSPTTEKALADALLEGFGLTFALRKFDMSVDLFLRSVTLGMVEQGELRKPLLSSAQKDASDTDFKLIQVRYVKVQKDSPEFMTVHEGVDQSVDTELSTFNISVAPEPILSLYDFIMTTFVPQDEPPANGDKTGDHEVATKEQEVQQKSTDKIRVRVKLTSVQVSLENNDVRFALLALPAVDVAIMLRAGTLRVGARLGNISLVDLDEGQVAVPAFKKLLSIEGEELADFSYETFDPTDEETFPGYNSSVNLRAGSLKFTFMEKPIRDLYAFALKFARMKAVYDAASQAAVQRASEVTRMHYDIVVKTPIIVLPRDGLTSPDVLVLRLGEIVAQNQYLGDANDTSTIKASLQGVNVASEIEYDGKTATLQMVNDVAINANIKQAGGSSHRGELDRADSEITTEMSDVKLSLTQSQYVLLMSIVDTLPRALSGVSDADATPDSMPDTPATESGHLTPVSEGAPSEAGVDLEPELSVKKSTGKDGPEVWTTLDFVFSVGSIALELYTGEAHGQADLQQHSIARFALSQTHVGMKQLSDGAMEAEFSLKALSFANTRAGKSVFRDIIPSAEHQGKQVMVQYTMAGGSDKSALAIVTIDSPRFILAVDPLAALLEFAMSPFKKSADQVEQHTQKEEVEAHEGPAEKKGSLALRVEIIDATVIVLADDGDSRSQAIQLNIREVLLSQQSVVALKVDKLGMSFGRMDRPNDRVKFLDELNIALSLDTRQRGSQQMTSFEVDIPDPVIFRASASNIMLIMDIVSKASAAATRATAPVGEVATVPDRRASLIGDATTTSTSIAPVASTKQSARRSSVSKGRRSSVDKSKVLVSKEQLKARINGFQFVLVGDLQELPFVHVSTNEFQVMVNDWSGDLKMGTSITTSIRYFNLTNSHFEPLMDPWKFDLRVNRTSVGPGQNPLTVKLSAEERLELNVTSAFIELAITTATVWSKEADRIKEGRGNDAPFRIRNRTGLSMMLWPEPHDLTKEIKKNAAKTLDDGAEVPWRFEDRKATRDNVSGIRHNSLGVKLEKCPWTEPLRGISVDQEGEQILYLRPKTDRVSHQLMCEVRLEHNIKVITFRSTLNVDNKTSHPVEMIVVDTHGKAMGGAMKIDPGESCPVPLTAVYDGRFRLRPLKGFGFDYGWSSMIHWTNLVKRPIRPISCKPMNSGDTAFYFQAEANFESDNPHAKVYPRLSLTLRAPIEIENLLPYNIKYRIHDKNSGISSSEYLVKGGTFPVHTVELSHLILLSIAPEDTSFKHSDYAIINTDDDELPQEDHFLLPDEHGLKLMLKLHYFEYPKSGGAKKVQIYSPYIIMNKTGLPFDLAAKTWTGGQKAVAGSDLFGNDHRKDTPTPFMFSYPNEDRRNRLFLKVEDSKWSKAVSFETVAADMQIVMSDAEGHSDYFVGLSYAEGLGKYKLTKVITIAPRFLVKNSFEYALRVRQPGSEKPIDLAPGERVPLHQLQSRAAPHLAMTLAGGDLKWTAPFSIADIGRTHLTLRRGGNRPKTYLMRVETHIEGSSIFIYISRETEPWPLRLQNDTNLNLTFEQVDKEGDCPKDLCRPIKLAPHSSGDYTWDYPTATNKRIQLYIMPRNNNEERQQVGKPIDMMAIGIQPPVKVRPMSSNQRSSTVSMDIQADGNSQLLVISHYNEDTSIYKPAKRGPTGIQRSESMDSLTTTAFETVAVSEKPTLSITVDFEGIGISVITKRPDELVYLSLRGLKLGYSDYPQYYDAFVDCKWIQIDNQLYGGLFPIILYPTVVPKDGKELESHPTLQASVAVLKDRAHGVWFIKYATILLQAMTIELDEDFLFALLDFAKFKDAAWKEPTQDILIEHPKEIPEPDISSGQADIFFEALQLQPMQLELSFMRTDRVNVDEKVSTRNPFYYALNALTMTLGNVNAAPLTFRALFLENSRLSMPSLMERVQLHYQEQMMAQIYRVLGSADFLGNPVGLFNNISSGFSDIFYEPYQGIVMHGNKDIGLGIARGATSFAKKTVFGITDSMTKFTSSIGKGLSAATLDAEYQSKRRMTQRRNKPKHALYGVAAGASAFADSVTSAFEGVASLPLEGAEKQGAAGFAKGVGKGFVGLFTKPVVGVMDFVSASTEGIRNTTTVFDQADLDRVRLPRYISPDGVVKPFSAREALGQSWLKEVKAGAYFHEQYIAHLGDDSVSILSNKRILNVQIRKLREIWEVSFEDLASLSLESSGIALFSRGGKPGPFLPVSEKAAREWYFRHIGRVVSAYNKAHAQRDD